MRKNSLKGLTLIELVFVVAILAILAGFLVPRLGALRNLAADAGNADQAFDLYALRHRFYSTTPVDIPA